MTIQSVSPFAASAATTQPTAAAATTATSGPATEQMFLQLLVAQLKNQDPMQPSDGAQFVAQLAQFSQLEQVIAIRKDTDTMAAPAPAVTPATGTGN